MDAFLPVKSDVKLPVFSRGIASVFFPLFKMQRRFPLLYAKMFPSAKKKESFPVLRVPDWNFLS